MEKDNNMNRLVQMYNHLRNNKWFSLTIVPIYRGIKRTMRIPEEKKRYDTITSLLKNRVDNNKRIYYLGSPNHANLGDLAQGVCTRKWLHQYFEDYEIVEIKTNCIVNTHYSVIDELREDYSSGDIIVFQSGYATTDLGGYADDMHCAVITALPHAKMLMLPQTVLFKSSERKNRTSRIYNSAKSMMFLARDEVSYKMAKDMFPEIHVMLYPDIVTTLIGSRTFNGIRNGILFCCRDDSEKYYSDEDIDDLIKRCSLIGPVEKTDTTKYNDTKEIVDSPEKYIWKEIEKYSKYRVVVTDRYHGTIFSLVAGTPVVIIRSTDHKVTTGATWFKGIYDEYVHTADSLEEAYSLVRTLYMREVNHVMKPYFEENYYSKLPLIFKEEILDR